MEQSLGWKIGFSLLIIGFVIVSQTTLAPVLPQLSLSKYITGFKFPEVIYGVNLVIIGWIIGILGIVCVVLATLDLPPFNF